jgi:DNA modification methylase
MVFTDPPYNVAYTGATKDKLTIKNDKMSSAKFYIFLRDAFTAAAAVVAPGAPIYVCHSDSEGMNFRKAMADSGFLAKSLLIWVKNHFTMGRMDYHMRHEPIIYGWREGAAHKWYGGRKLSTVVEEMPGLVFQQEEEGFAISFSDGVRAVAIKVPSYEVTDATDGMDASVWKVDKPLKSAEHPTMKPVEIPRRAIANSSKNGGIVFEPFMGSGSTLIACEMIGRLCYGLELDPKYCDVIVTRWEQFTGRQAQLLTPAVVA